MSFDISRSTFRPRKNFLGVVMEQGRVQLDSDWNEWQSEYSRRIQAGTLDTIGQAVYPASTPNAFKITTGTNSSGNNTLFIGAGRYYIDGVLAENHGPESQAAWDSALAELSGAPAFSTTTAETDYAQQPHLPNPALPVSGQIYLAYLDVWERDVTYLEDPDLIDKAVNIDTTGRLQTVWQVKLLNLGSPTTTPDCSTDVPAFDALQQPPAGRLTNGLVPNAASGPCCLSPNTGYTGQENQLYRVEIHQAGAPSAAPSGGFTFPLPANTPAFKWSRDDASVQTSVTAISSVTTSSGSVSQLTVASLGRDQVLGFTVNDWIEITDDAYELNGEAGEIYQITGVTAATNTITLSAAVSSHFQLTNGQTTPGLHTRITRWDQSGQVYQTDSSGNTTSWINLNSTGSTGVIPVPPVGTTLVLENGITASFALSPEPTSANPTTFRIADYWLFAARASDGSIETLNSAPPLGINHHYTKLSIVDFPSTASNCRNEWPPSQSGGCTCAITVSPSDLTGDTTLQTILNNYQNSSTATTICLEPGTYSLSAPLRLSSAFSNITIEACQPGTVLVEALAANKSSFNDGLIVLDNCESITLSGLSFIGTPAPYSAATFAGLASSALPSSVATMVQNLLVSVGVRIVGGDNISIQNCNFEVAKIVEGFFKEGASTFGAGIFINGQNTAINVEGCEFFAQNPRLAESSQAFLTGIGMASSVSFTTPATAPSAPTNLSGTVGTVTSGATIEKGIGNLGAAQASAALVSQTPKVSPKVSRKAAAAPRADLEKAGTSESAILANEPALNLGSIATEIIADRPGLQNIGGQLQNIGTFGNFNATPLAAQGGAVLAASLDQSAITGNTFVNLTAAALLLGETAGLNASQNQIACRAGIWLLTPSQTQTLLLDPQNLALLGAAVALAYPLPQGDTSSTVTVAAAPSSIFLYATNSKTNHTDSNGNVWVPDTNPPSNVTVSGGAISEPTPPAQVTGTSDPTLYQAERYGNSFSYTFSNLATGFYSITLKFAEIFYRTPPNTGVRVFDVSINGQAVLTDFDIVADAGGALIADDKTFTNIAPSGGQIVVQFTGTSVGTDTNAKVDALDLIPLWTGAPYLGAGDESDSALFFDQLAQVAWQAYAGLSFSPARWRFEANELQNLTAVGLLLLGDDSLVNGDSGSLMLVGNRIDGQIQVDANFNNLTFNETAATQEARANFVADVPTNIAAFYNPRVFYSLVMVNGLSRTVVTSNMVTNGNSSNGYGLSLVLYNNGVQQAAAVIMSNVFAGRFFVPSRNLNDSTLDAFAQSWNFLNTVI